MNDEEFRKKLTPEQYKVLREKGTEAPFSGALLQNKERGMYTCVACGAKLFSSDAKFDSGTGWPSFDEPMNRENVELKEDVSHSPPSLGFGRAGMKRTEVICRNCGSHLGHVFDDLPVGRRVVRQDGKPAKKRYCINSVCLAFEKEEKKA